MEKVAFKDLKAGKDGYKDLTTTFDSEFYQWSGEVGEVFIGKFVEIMQAGKKGQEKDCALFQEKKTGKSYLMGQQLILDAVKEYGQLEYRIEFIGKKKGKKFTYNNYKIGAK